MGEPEGVLVRAVQDEGEGVRLCDHDLVAGEGEAGGVSPGQGPARQGQLQLLLYNLLTITCYPGVDGGAEGSCGGEEQDQEGV